MLRQGNELHIQNFDDNKDEYYVSDIDLWSLEDLIFNNVKVIKLDDIDTGKKELTEIEKWKRRVVNRQKSVKNKLTLINPDIYNNFLLFYKLSISDKTIQKFHHIINYYLSRDGFGILRYKEFKNNYINRYKDIKIYEDKLFKKFSKYLN